MGQRRKLSNQLSGSGATFDTSIGATLVESALTILLFLGLVFFLIDGGRYLFYRIFLNHAALRGLDMAMKLPLEVYTTNSHCQGDQRAICDNYLQSVHAIVGTITEMATKIGSTDPGAGLTLKGFDHYLPADYADSYLSPLSNKLAVFIRPGERVQAHDSGEVINHPTRPAGNQAGQGWPDGINETWVSVMDQNPLLVFIEAEFHPVTPFIPSITMQIKQIGFRAAASSGQVTREIPQLVVGPPPAPQPTAEPRPECACCYDSIPGNCPPSSNGPYCSRCGGGV